MTQYVSILHNLHLHIKTETVLVGSDATVYTVHCTVCPAFVYIFLALKSDNIHRCICFNQDSLGLYAEIQIIFGAVEGHPL